MLGDKNSIFSNILLLYSGSGTAQVKDIKPGVLSKIFILAERNPGDIKEDDMKKLCVACKGLQDSILDFASHKVK